ncbi:MAG: hypothetical protein ABIP34_23400 [Rhodoferax sp.]|uniref:CAP domain-containing protein n=1 Tax=Rhodoferax sp. TaxID=50421 RepID=UPI003267D1E9
MNPSNMLTKQKLSTRLSLLLSAGALALLSACGGGGGGGAGVDVNGAATVVEVTTTPVTPVVVVPVLVASSYGAGSEELSAFNLLNYERDRCGFGLWAQNTQLDAAAKSHADYQILNSVVSHTETLAAPGFTGRQPIDRIIARSYTATSTATGGVTDEIVAYNGTDSKTGLGANGIRGLLNAPYHLRGLMGTYRDVGLSVRSSADLATSTPSVYLQIDAAYKTAAGPQVAGSTDINTYPCEGSTGINNKLSNESPNPVPGRDLATSPLGSVVYVAVKEGNTLTISSVRMSQVSNGQAVTLRTPITSTNDPYRGCSEGCFKPNQAYVAADAPLQINTAYQVSVSGGNNTATFTRTFTFTTGSGS